jgi:acetyl esterase
VQVATEGEIVSTGLRLGENAGRAAGELSPLDVRARVFLTYLRAVGWPELSRRTVAQSRRDVRLLAAATSQWRPVASVRDALVREDGVRVRVRVYRPLTRFAPGPRPLVVWFHGGGFVVGDLFTADGTCRTLAHNSGAIVVSVHYRRAPESPLPAAHTDAVAAAQWAVRHAVELGADPSRVVIGGDSAGGCLAAHVAQRLPSAGPQAAALQLLAYPATDLTMAHADLDPDVAKLLTATAIDWFGDRALAGVDRTDATVSPFFAEDLTGLPPAFLITAGIDPMRSDGLAYAGRLAAAGVHVEHRDFPGQLHGFLGMDLVFPAGARALRQAGRAIAAVAPVAGPADPAASEPICWLRAACTASSRVADSTHRLPPVYITRVIATLAAHHARSLRRRQAGELPIGDN